MPTRETIFSNPTFEQQQAWEAFNQALGWLAAAHGVDPDDLNEVAGAGVETAIACIAEDQAA